MRILDRLPLALLHLAFVASSAYAQADARSVVLSVRVEADGAPLADARIRVGSAGALTNTVGIAQLRLPVGPVTVTVLRLGYAPDSLRLVLADGRDTLVTFTLTDVAASMSSVVITSARGATRIEETPLRVEALAGEDVAEKTEMRPADVTGFLSEMSGVRVQRTSAASGAAGVRLQGLRPRYTLLLTDGLPLNSATGSGLDILQLPPADLKQVEVVKGPATALYGPAALGGMINLVSKRPAHERDVLVQQSSERGTNAFGWYSERWSPSWGMTALVGGHEQSRRDLNADGWADMPGFSRVEVRPRIFFDGANGAGILITAGLTNETREGGFLPGQLAPDATTYAERYRTRRSDIGMIAHRIVGRSLVQWRVAVASERQAKRYGSDDEHTSRLSGFGEVSVGRQAGAHDLLFGVAAQHDRNDVREAPGLDYRWRTASLFVQDVWRATDRFAVTGSGRVDQHSRFGPLVGPRISALYTLRPGLTARASWASGESAPSPYVEETNAVGVRRISGFAGVRPERAVYASADVTGTSGPFEINFTLFDTCILDAVQSEATGATIAIRNADAPVRAHGTELFAALRLDDFIATALYSFTDSREPVFGGRTMQESPYLPRQSGGLDLTWESEGTGTWIALEGFHSGHQHTRDDPYVRRTASYVVVGLLIGQQLGSWRLFSSIENLTDVRQTRASPLLLTARTTDGRWTTAPWGQLEGRVISMGARWSKQGRPHASHSAPPQPHGTSVGTPLHDPPAAHSRAATDAPSRATASRPPLRTRLVAGDVPRWRSPCPRHRCRARNARAGAASGVRRGWAPA